MLVTLVGLGCGTAATMTAEGLEALRRADCLLGAGRLLAAVPENGAAKRGEATRPRQLLDALLESGAERPCVVYSGDTGFYSGTRGLLALLAEAGIESRVLPGISSVQLLAARLGRPWQAWKLCSAHGTDCDPVTAVMGGQPAFFLTGGARGPVPPAGGGGPGQPGSDRGGKSLLRDRTYFARYGGRVRRAELCAAVRAAGGGGTAPFPAPDRRIS